MQKIYQYAEKHFLSPCDAYTYKDMLTDLSVFKDTFPDTTLFTIGKSFEGRNLHALKIGRGAKKIFLCGAHHGMEWMTAKACIDFSADCLNSNLLDDCSLFVVPMVNPDGVEIASMGYRWQNNARGVDLNHNYDALWALGCGAKNHSGTSKYRGPFPESEPEAYAIANFTRQNNFDIAIALHSQGQVVYYDFCGIIPTGTEKYINKISASSVYKPELPSGTALYGGYKDWFIKKYKKPAFTLEIGLGENPLPMSTYANVYKEAYKALVCFVGE